MAEMIVFRVGKAGAVVLNEFHSYVPPGTLIYADAIEAISATEARPIHEAMRRQPKRIGRYADKVIRPAEDKAR